jgi:hypothetical protein
VVDRVQRTGDFLTEIRRSLDDQARIAALERDVPALERLWSDQLVVNAPNNQVVIGKRAVIDDFVRTGIINFSSFERQIEFIRIDGDLAAVHPSRQRNPATVTLANTRALQIAQSQ